MMRQIVIIFLQFILVIGHAQETDNYLLWASTGPTYYTQSRPVAIQSDLDIHGNLYVIGNFYKEVPVDPNIDPNHQTTFVQHIFITKYDTDGNVIWNREFGNSVNANLGGDLRIDNNGNIVVTGFVYDLAGEIFGVPIQNGFLAKLDSDGNIIWVREATKLRLQTYYSSTAAQSHMEIDSDNSIVLFYDANPLGSPRNETSGLYISRYSSDGNLIKHIQVSQDDNFDTPLPGGLAIDDHGDFIITGTYHVSLKLGPVTFGIPGPPDNGPVRLFIAKYKSTGEFSWARQVGFGFSLGYDVETDPSNHIYLTGLFDSYATFGDSEQRTNTNDLSDINPSEVACGFLAKISPAGDLVQVKPFQRLPTFEYNGSNPLSIKRTNAGNLYITGTCNFGSSYEDFSLVRFGEQSFVIKLNPDMSFESAVLSDGEAVSYPYKVGIQSSIDQAGNVYTIGKFNQRIVFGCDTLSTQADNLFITKYSAFPPNYKIDIKGPNPLCSGALLKLTGTDIPKPIKYFWELPDGVVNLSPTDPSTHEMTATVDPSANNTYIKLKMVKGCYRYESVKPYQISILNPPSETYLNGNTLFCEPGTSTFLANRVYEADSYVWSLPPGITSTENSLVTKNPSLDVSISSNFVQGIISVKPKNVCAEGAPAKLAVSLLKKPIAPTFIDTQKEFCNRGQQVSFEIAKSESRSEFEWSIPGTFKESGTIKAGEVINVTIAKGGSSVISVREKNICHQGDAAFLNLTIRDPLQQPVIEKNDCDTELFIQDGLEIKWYMDDQLVSIDTTYLRPERAGAYLVTMTNICGTVSSKSIVAMPVLDQLLTIPNVITPNADGKNDFFTLTTSMKNMRLDIYNRWGNSVYHSIDYQNDWDGRDLTAGEYFFSLQHSCLMKKYEGWLHIIR